MNLKHEEVKIIMAEAAGDNWKDGLTAPKKDERFKTEVSMIVDDKGSEIKGHNLGLVKWERRSKMLLSCIFWNF